MHIHMAELLTPIGYCKSCVILPLQKTELAIDKSLAFLIQQCLNIYLYVLYKSVLLV